MNFMNRQEKLGQQLTEINVCINKLNNKMDAFYFSVHYSK